MADDFSNLASPQVISRMLYLVNAERGDANQPAVEGAEALHRAAQAHSEDMARKGYLDSRGPDGQSAEGLGVRAGYDGAVSALVYSGPTSIAAVAAWMKGPGRDLLLSPHLLHLGVGLAESKWTLLLGGRAGLAPSPVAVGPAASGPLHHPSPSEEIDGTGDTMAMNLAAATAALAPAEVRVSAAGPTTAQAAVVPEAALQTQALGLPFQEQRLLDATPAIIEEVLGLVSAERGRWHLPPLALSEELCRAAQAHADDMLRRDYFAVLGPDGESAQDRAARAGYGGRCGACLAFGQLSAEMAVAYLMQDAASQRSLLNNEYVHLGVGVRASRWVLLLGMPQAPQQPSAPPRSRLPFDLSLPKLPFGGAATLPQGPDPQLAHRVLALINTERTKHAIFPLAVSEQLCQAAQEHSNDMASHNYLAYVGPDGQGVESRVAQHGYGGRCGANLCVGHSSAESAVKFFMQNEGNRQNVLYPEYRHLGVGAAKGRWTLIFGIPQAAPPQAAAGPQVVARTLELINGERSRAGLAHLALSEPLCRAAQAHAEDMARRGYVGSVTPEGEDVGKRVDRAGYRWRSVTESTASDRATPEEAVEAWLRTADHRANLLDAEFRHVGIGVAQGRWALVFARPQ